MSIKALPYIILLGFFFGSSLVASRFSVGQYDPTTYIGLRMIIASLISLTIYWRISGRGLPRSLELWKRASLLGVFGTAVPMTCVVSSLQYQSSGISSLLLTTAPAMTVILAHFLLPDELLNRRRVIGVVLALGGAVLLAVSGEDGLPDIDKAVPTGYILVGIGMVFSSLMIIYARKYLRGYDAYDVASVRIFSAATVMVPFSLLTAGFDMSAVTEAGVFGLLYAAIVGTFMGLMLSFYNIKRFGATSAVMATYVVPIVAGIGGVLVLGEEITATMLFGMVAIISGIALLQEYQKKRNRLGRNFRFMSSS